VFSDLSGVSTVVKPELGNKHQCQNCGTKFFDLNKNPAVCPKCGTVYQVAMAARSQRVPDDEETDTEAEVDLVSLDEAEASEDKVVAATDDDVEIEDEGDDDTFLEEEEEDSDDVSGLIDGDLAGDEEP
jgi:uncharacterized protein (TIGR02300 family)